MKDDGQHKLKYLYNIEKTKETEAVLVRKWGVFMTEQCYGLKKKIEEGNRNCDPL